MAETPDWPRRGRRRMRLALLGGLFLIFIAGGTAVSYYVDALWFDSLGYVDVFWKTLNLQAEIFTAFFLITFLVLYGSFVVLKPPRLGDLAGFPLLINGQPIQLPVEPVLRLIALVRAVVVRGADGVATRRE